MHTQEFQQTVSDALRVALRDTDTPIPRLRRIAARAIEIADAYPNEITADVLIAFWREHPECAPTAS